ncbi:hypothetical protein PoB_006403500 [Plakobranchus ocellatus]|uniref:Uncharacterized protein n=1 Tax=Plakobranchus ocellatus TaxID=259542 RepID=A0AAV4D0G0_9GAST|nr:hypothetical protein PoB_006403500 [Plakobranchus ocellatus]
MEHILSRAPNEVIKEAASRPKANNKTQISLFWSPLGSALMTERTATYCPYRFHAEFVLNCATLIPWLFKETARFQGGVRIREPQTKNAARPYGTLLLSSSPHLISAHVTIGSHCEKDHDDDDDDDDDGDDVGDGDGDDDHDDDDDDREEEEEEE